MRQRPFFDPIASRQRRTCTCRVVHSSVAQGQQDTDGSSKLPAGHVFQWFNVQEEGTGCSGDAVPGFAVSRWTTSGVFGLSCVEKEVS